MEQSFHIPDLEDSSKASTGGAILFITKNAIPEILIVLSFFLRDMMAFHFVGYNYGETEVAALSLSQSVVSFVGISVIFGISAGIQTIVAQAYGARNYILVRKYFKYGVYLVSVSVLIGSVLFFFISDIFKLCGLDEKLADASKSMFRVQILFFATFSYYFMFNLFSQGLGHFWVSCFVQMASVPLSWIFSEWLIHTGPEGALLAKGLSVIPNTVVMALYFAYFDVLPKAVSGSDETQIEGGTVVNNEIEESEVLIEKEMENIENQNPQDSQEQAIEDLRFGQFSKRAITQGSAIFLESIFVDVVVLIVAFGLSNVDVSAVSLTVNFACIILSFYYGIGLITNVVVGNLVGQGRLALSLKYAKLSLKIGLVPAGLSVLFLLFGGNHLIAGIYTDIPEVYSLGAQVLFMHAFATLLDCESNIMANILRAVGQENFVARGYLLAYYCGGIPCLLIVRLVFNGNALVCWGCALVGYYLMFGQMAYKFWTINWEKETEKVHHALEEERVQQEEIKKRNS